jgi:Tfp pilus assembly PilM family ATPase
LQSAIEVASKDSNAIKVAFSSFKGKRCVISIASADVLVQHIRVPFDVDENEIRQRLIKHDTKWEDAEIRNVCITTTEGSGKPRQELLCVGIECKKTQEIMEIIDGAGGEVVAVTVPLYGSICAFDQLYRRDGDEKITSLLIDMDEDSSMVMIAHGASCVFAHRLDTRIKENVGKAEHKLESTPSLTPVATAALENEFERRCEKEPRGLRTTQHSEETVEEKVELALMRCLRHHDALFPDRAVGRVIFTGRGASNTQACAAIATKLGIVGYVADPSAWITGAEEYAAGPEWTTVAGICIRYSGRAA